MIAAVTVCGLFSDMVVLPIRGIMLSGHDALGEKSSLALLENFPGVL